MVFRKVPKMKNSDKKCFSQYRKIGDNKYDVYFKYVTRMKTNNTKGQIHQHSTISFCVRRSQKRKKD